MYLEFDNVSMKKTTYLLLYFAVISLSSCNKGGDNSEISLLSDPQIHSFKLSFTLKQSDGSDSIDIFAPVKFSIDQVNSRIFNADSMPFYSEIGEAKCTMTTKSSIRSIFFPDAAVNTDSIVWNGTDSLDFSKKKSALKVYSQNGEHTKTYEISINVYSINAELFVWKKAAIGFIPAPFALQRTVLMPDSVMYMYIQKPTGFELITSHINDGVVWTGRELQGFPAKAKIETIQRSGQYLFVADSAGILYNSSVLNGLQWNSLAILPSDSVITLLGGLNGNLEMIIKREPEPSLLLASYSPEKEEIIKTTILPAQFPIEGFASIEYRQNHLSHLMLAGGTNTSGELLNEVWVKISFADQMQDWMRIEAPDAIRFSQRKGAILLPYDNKLMLIGGYGVDKYLKDIYFSDDHGINWILADELKTMPDDFTPRAYPSAMVDNRNFVTIIGGQNSEPLNDLWRGRIHYLAK